MIRKLFLLLVAAMVVSADDLRPACSKPVYCDSDLLHYVQLARNYPDSKTFVDYPMRNDPNTTLSAFDNLMATTNNNPTKEEISDFVEQYFDTSGTGELDDWIPPDYEENPEFLNSIQDADLRQFGKDINGLWNILGRKIKPEVFANPDRFSLIPVTHGIIIPGGRFKELYYWDTYWIIEGLLISDMKETAKGVIENLIELVKLIGHVPNGSRWYYQERSQPPLLTAMVSLYYKYTKDDQFLRDNIDALETEIKYWLDTQIVAFEKDCKTYTLLRYYALSKGPRPESYYEDHESAQIFGTDERKTEFYIDIKSAAESGWDFSTRWFDGEQGENTGNLTTIHTKNIIPVDLNAIFANALSNIAEFNAILKRPNEAAHYEYIAKQWRSTIEEVLWHEKDGIWYDYDINRKKHRRYFFPSNVAPLWMGAASKSVIARHTPRIIIYLLRSGALSYPGGVPASLSRSGEQWDFPNAWPPLVSMVVNALEAMDNVIAQKLAFRVAQTWIRACHKGFTDNQQMFEKYDVEQPGVFGGGGEYTVQIGFGWSNGVVLEFLDKYGDILTAHD